MIADRIDAARKPVNIPSATGQNDELALRRPDSGLLATAEKGAGMAALTA